MSPFGAATCNVTVTTKDDDWNFLYTSDPNKGGEEKFTNSKNSLFMRDERVNLI